MKSKLNSKLFPFLIFVTIIAAFSYYLVDNDNAKPKTEYMTASWVYGYSNIKELVAESDLVALIQIEGTDEEWELSSLPHTNYKATILNSIINKKNEENNILITMTGVSNETKHMEIEDDPLLQKGEQFIIFARKNDKNTYTILGGPQGRFKNINGKLYSMKYVSDRVNWGNIDINGETLDSFKTKVQEK